jgi:tricorn protease
LRQLLQAALLSCLVASSASAATPHIFQHPALSRDLIAFGYADDLWTVPREGGKATRLTNGVGIEFAPIFSPDGSTIAFTADYDGNTDVYTIPATGGIPHRVTFHPAPDIAVAWTPDGKSILFRSNRDAASRYTRLFTVPATGGPATPLPLPMAAQGEISPDGSRIAYSPLPQAFGFDYLSFVSWGNYRGGRAGTINVTTLPGLDTIQVPHETAADFSPTWCGGKSNGKLYFLSGRNGPITLFSYDPASKAVTELVHPASKEASDLRSVSGGPNGLVYDQLGDIFLYDPATGKAHAVPIDIAADLPEVRPHFKSVAGEVENIAISPTGLRAVVEAHGDILTIPAKNGPTRNLTNTPGAAEREPAWSPDGQSIAFFSDEASPEDPKGLYQLHIVGQTGAGPVKRFPLTSDPAYYFSPLWSPDSKRIAFHDNHNRVFILDIASGKLSTVDDSNVFGGFSSGSFDVAWSPDSKWLAYPHSTANHLHALYLYSVETGKSTQFTSQMGDSRNPAFDRNGKYLYFTASTNFGATSDGLDMTSDLYTVTRNVYAVVLAADQPSPVAPQSDDEKTLAESKEKPKDDTEAKPSGDSVKPVPEADSEKSEAKPEAKPAAPKPPKPIRIDLPGIESRIVALPLPAQVYTALSTGKPGTVYFLTNAASNRFADREAGTLSRFVLETRKTEKLADRVAEFYLSADGDKMLLRLSGSAPEPGGPPSEAAPRYVIVPANAPVKPDDSALSFAGLQVRVDPAAEWTQMYHEVWRIERAYFYDANFHGVDTFAVEKRLARYAAAITSRADLNYIFQEMLTGFSVGHLRGNGGAIPEARKIPGGLLGADYVIRNNRYCIAKIYTGGDFNPQDKAPLAQPGLNISTGDCILAIDGQDLTASMDIQQPLEGTAGRAITLRIATGTAAPRDVTVIPLRSEYALRNIDWIDSNQRKVDQLSGGKLAYVYLPDTAEGGFTNFNRYYFAQLDKKGAVIDERFNGGGQIADYIIEVMRRQVESFWAPRYGAIEHTPNAAIYGPKVMIVNEFAGSGGDAMPWLFRYNHIGPLVGKRTWGGLVGIGGIPVLMDGGHVTSPSVAFFSPAGQWDVENHGVDPDVVVDQDPKAVAEGHDPQLEKAVAVALEELAKHPPVEPTKPPYPNYHKP